MRSSLFIYNAICGGEKGISMASSRYDITIIGGGSGGLTAAQIAANLGLKVLLIDKERLGGDCLYYGCVPSKSLIHIAQLVHQAQSATNLITQPGGDQHIDMAKATTSIHDIIARIGDAEKSYVEGVTVEFGHVSFVSPQELRIGDETIASHTTILATGSYPAIPDVEGLAGCGYLTNEDVFDLTALPRSLIVIGGGPIGMELAQALHRLGTRVTIVQGSEHILPKEDPEVSTTIAALLKDEGIEIITCARLIKAASRDGQKVVSIKQGEQVLELAADELLVATGRKPHVETLNLEAAGVKYDQRHGIQVNDYLQTSASHIYAIGDVIGGYLFTHVAAAQAGVAVRNAILPIGKQKMDYRVVPWCTFTDPEVARVGLTPEEARQQHKAVRIITMPWSEIDRAQTTNETRGFIKLILANKREEIVGAHLVGAHAGELLGEISLAMRHHLTISDLLETIHPYPTFSTGLQQVALKAYLEGPAIAGTRKLIAGLTNWR
jgi:dihydrolipoamide dehydrogenase